MELTDKAKKKLKAILVDIDISYNDIAVKSKVSVPEISRALNPIPPNQVKALNTIVSIIKRKRPDLDIDAILNS